MQLRSVAKLKTKTLNWNSNFRDIVFGYLRRFRWLLIVEIIFLLTSNYIGTFCLFAIWTCLYMENYVNLNLNIEAYKYKLIYFNYKRNFLHTYVNTNVLGVKVSHTKAVCVIHKSNYANLLLTQFLFVDKYINSSLYCVFSSLNEYFQYISQI